MLHGCARASDDGPLFDADAGRDPVPDTTWDLADPVDIPADEPPDPSTDPLPDSDARDAVDDFVDILDPDVTEDPMDPDPVHDPPPEGTDGPCAGTGYAGCCWYLGGGTHPSCTNVCSSHGGYNSCTMTWAGSGGSEVKCDAVLTALGLPNPGTTSTLIGSGAGVGCFWMDVASDRYWVRDTPTTEGATYTLARRACACNN